MVIHACKNNTEKMYVLKMSGSPRHELGPPVCMCHIYVCVCSAARCGPPAHVQCRPRHELGPPVCQRCRVPTLHETQGSHTQGPQTTQVGATHVLTLYVQHS